jgi:alpha-ribazole phosphatase
MKITLVRHIKTVAPEGMCYGQTDVELPPGFELQHAKIADRLQHHRFDVIWSSPLKRCALLAQAIAGKEQEIKYDNRLKELHFGEWEQKMWNDIETLPEAIPFFKDYINTPPPGGESFQSLIERIASFLEEIKQNETFQHLLIVTHGGCIRAFHSLINNTKAEAAFDLKVDYGDVYELHIDKM